MPDNKAKKDIIKIKLPNGATGYLDTKSWRRYRAFMKEKGM